MRFAVGSLHHFDGPCLQVDWGTLSCLDEVVVILYPKRSVTFISEPGILSSSQKVLEVLGDLQLCSGDMTGSFHQDLLGMLCS